MGIDYTPPDRKLLDLTLGEMGISNGTVLNDVGLQTHRIDEARNAVDYGVPFPGGPVVRRSKQPWFPAVDRWVAGISRKTYLQLAIVGAIAGFGYGFDTTGTVTGSLSYALGGLVVGVLVPSVLALLIKALILAAVTTAALGVVYLLMNWGG